MECLLQYLDDIDDAVFAVGLLGERLRRFAGLMLRVLALTLLSAGFALAVINRPPLAMAIAALLAVGLLYRSVVAPLPVASRP